ncbi:MAG: GNAT family N-acetyltransferase [Lachnospiraceae bacterium]
MREIRKLNESHIDQHTIIYYNAYPSYKDFSSEAILKHKALISDTMKNDPNVEFYGLFEGGRLLAAARYFRLKMNCFGKVIDTGGLGSLCVDLTHKKQNLATQLVGHFEEYCVANNMPIAVLLPFRPDYYKKQGYGFGAKTDRYRIKTEFIPLHNHEEGDLRYIEGKDRMKLLECHKRYVLKTHGMIMKIENEIRDLSSNQENRVVASFDKDGQINGYLNFRFENGKSDNYTINHIYVNEMVYDSTYVLYLLLGFLRKQQDQVQLVIFDTSLEVFHYLFNNPLNDSNNCIPFGIFESNTQNLGVMYKVLDAEKAFRRLAYRQYGSGDFTACFHIYKENKKEIKQVVNIAFSAGNAEVLDHEHLSDTTIILSESNFSSLFLGCLSVHQLYAIGLVQMDADYVDRLDRVLYCREKPYNNTDF